MEANMWYCLFFGSFQMGGLTSYFLMCSSSIKILMGGGLVHLFGIHKKIQIAISSPLT
jgi:hypothetical protein